MRVNVRVSRAAVFGYVAGLAFDGACWILTGNEVWQTAATYFAIFVPLGYWWGRSDEAEEAGP